ncbi:hypothetical protein KOM00_14680 [Geomonas sp. Red69]|uniref:hypothetical protein n=2 Tax=Geomonas diazotrophica TaxID=2843197 RepID=UPI001C10FA36|nr:hypothetical protein [Geomonas diazotrophica]MBU5637972.1 hypothetical protein [Geomonas diazotrophica]
MTYDQTNGKYISAYFGQTATSANPNLATLTNETQAYIPFPFSSLDGLKQSADLTALGNMNDCAECHVGGGGMEYIPKYIANGSIGSPLGTYAAGVVGGPLSGGAYPGSAAPDPANRVSLRSAGLLDTVYTAFNYLIDVFGPKGDGKDATYEPKYNNFAQSGVLEMDCLACHQQGYNWEARKHAVRALGFDASRVTGAGFGTYSTGSTPSTTVTYDLSKLVAAEGGGYKLSATEGAKILGVPASENCASCHAATQKEKYQVEWKKRGDYWGASEVHGNIGCMGCHERNTLTATGEIDKTTVGTSGIANNAAANKKLGLCDPAKGGDSGYDAQWNAMDKVAFKNCADCHLSTAGNGKTYGAPNPTAAHAAKGLTAIVAQKQFNASGQLVSNGVANASHLDIIDCTVCHSRKTDVQLPLYDANGVFRSYTSFHITGGAMVDGTGKDEEGRLATHDTVNVEREMYDNYSLYWNNGKLFLGSFLTSFFWRDMNTMLDANKDGRGPGLDPILPTHIARINVANSDRNSLTHDGVVTGDEIAGHISTITAQLPAMIGNPTEPPIIKLSALAVPFKWTHNVSPATEALGQSCADCHSASSTFLNKKVVVSPKTNFTYNAGQLVNYTKVNGSTQATDMHPNVVNKAGNRSVAVPIFTPTAAGNLTDDTQAVQRAAMIYEGTFTNINTGFSPTAITGSTRPAVGAANSPWYDATNKSTGTAGWVTKLDVKETATGTVKSYTFANTDNTMTNVAAVVAHMNSVGFANNSHAYGFTITDGGSEQLVITPAAGYEVRVNPQTDVGPLGLSGALYAAQKLKGVNNLEYAGRGDWLTYFNNITAAGTGIGVDPVADIATVAGQAANGGSQIITVTKGATVDLVAADAASAGSFTYSWLLNSGASLPAGKSISYNFPTTGLFTLTLNVVDEEGKFSTVNQKVNVVAADPVTVGTITVDAAKATTIPLTISGPYTSVTFAWGDGSASTTSTDTSGSISKSHTYARYAKYAVADADPNTAGNQAGYKWTTNIRVYNGSTLVSSKNVAVYNLQ